MRAKKRKKNHVSLKSLALKAVIECMKHALKKLPITCDKYK